MCAKDPVSRELNKTIVSSRSHINTLSTVLSTSSGLPPFWLLRLVLQLLLVEFTLAPPLPEFRFLESFFRATKKDRYVVVVVLILEFFYQCQRQAASGKNIFSSGFLTGTPPRFLKKILKKMTRCLKLRNNR